MRPANWNSRRVSSILALALLALQASVPWIAGDYITQDGPSHLYTAIVFKNLVFHPHGPYASVYRLQPRLVTNWGTVLLFGLLHSLFGAQHAESALATLSVLASFAAVTYFRRSVDPDAPNYDPVSNFLISSWFLWIGFYNFYLGMALCLFLTGFYIRHARSFTIGKAVALGAGSIGLFFVHVLPAAVAMMAIGLVAIWLNVCVPSQRNDLAPPSISRRLSLPSAALAPAILLLFIFSRRGITTLQADSASETLRAFPINVFASVRSPTGEEHLLLLLTLIYMTVGALAMSKSEWFTARPAVLGAALTSFVGCLIVPDYAFGGNAIKARLAWSIFLFGCPLAASVKRMKRLQAAMSLCIACLLVASLIATVRNLRNVSRAANAYFTALEGIPEGTSFVRLRYPTAAIKTSFGFDMVQIDPLLHADAWVASRRRLIDLTDPWAATRVYPICFRKEVPGQQQIWLWNMEDEKIHGPGPVVGVLDDLALRFDYLVFVGDSPSNPTGNTEFMNAQAFWAQNMTELRGSGNGLIRLYRRF